jgi:hypothetical protein
MKIITLSERGWMSVEALARHLGVSERTIYNRLRRGDVEKRVTDDGAKYRLKPTESTFQQPFSNPFSEVHEPFSESPTESLSVDASPAPTLDDRLLKAAFHETATATATESLSVAIQAIATLVRTNAELVADLRTRPATDDGALATLTAENEALRARIAVLERADEIRQRRKQLNREAGAIRRALLDRTITVEEGDRRRAAIDAEFAELDEEAPDHD